MTQLGSLTWRGDESSSPPESSALKVPPRVPDFPLVTKTGQYLLLPHLLSEPVTVRLLTGVMLRQGREAPVGTAAVRGKSLVYIVLFSFLIL